MTIAATWKQKFKGKIYIIVSEEGRSGNNKIYALTLDEAKRAEKKSKVIFKKK